MSTKEKVYSMVDSLNEEQLKALFVILDGMVNEKKPKTKKTAASLRGRSHDVAPAQIRDKVDAVCGILHEYANPDLIPFEKEAWAEAAAEEERRFLEEMNSEDD